MDDARSRRALLRGAGLGAIGAIAGCLRGNEPTEGPATSTEGPATGTEGPATSTEGASSETATELPPDAATADALFRGDNQRTGVFPDVTVPEDVAVEWLHREINTGDHTAAKASPVPTPDGDVVVTGDTGTIWRFSPDGEVVWETSVGEFNRGFHGTPTIANGRAYVGAYDGVLYAFDLETGDVDWQTDLGDAIGSSPGYHDGTVYIAVEYYDPSGAMFGVDADSGDVVWDDQRPTNHPHSSCAIDHEAGRLVVGSNDGKLYAWSYPDLEFAWSFPTGEPIKGPIATDGQRAYFGSWDDHVYGVDLAEGIEEWSFQTGYLVMAGPAVETATDTVYIGSHDGNLYALEAGTGTERWRFDTDGWIIGCPTVTDGHVLIGSYDEYCYAIDKTTGDERWRVQGVGRVTSSPLVLDDSIYFTDRASQTYIDDGSGETGALYKVVAADQV